MAEISYCRSMQLKFVRALFKDIILFTLSKCLCESPQQYSFGQIVFELPSRESQDRNDIYHYLLSMQMLLQHVLSFIYFFPSLKQKLFLYLS